MIRQFTQRTKVRPFWHLMQIVMMFGFVMLSGEVMAQATISGAVNDTQGNSLPGVTILVKGTSSGTVTDIDGKYSIGNVKTSDVLVFSFIGTVTQEVTVGNKTVFDVTLDDDIKSLDEVIVVGYGTQRQKDVTGSVAKVSSQDLESRPNTQLGSLIQGKAAGVQIVSSSGKPSQGLSIRIRGTNSITAGSEPLYVVDGVPTNDTRSVNPADIESIVILKDASSAAIYGAQGANGVVLITTKQGSSKKATISLSAYGGFSQVWKKQDVLDASGYRKLMTEMGKTTDWAKYTENTNWQDKVFQNGVSQNYQLSISGANDKTNYYISGGWVGQQGAVRSAEMDRSNFKINLTQDVYDWLKIGTRLAYTKYRDVDVTDNTNVNSGGVLLGALSTPPIIGVYNPNGTFTSNPFQNWENPLASTDGPIREYNNARILSNAYAEIKFLKDFKFKTNLGIDNSNGIYDYFLDPFKTSYGRALMGRAINNTDKTTYYINDNTLSYSKKLNQHTFDVLVGTVHQKYLWENSAITTQNFSGSGIITTNAGSTITEAKATKSEKVNISYLSRINYAYADKYLLTANFRIDGSSIFGSKNRWGYFPSFSAGWRISEESFLNNVNVLSDLKVRAGWGIVGNDQINNYGYLGRVGGGANYPIGGATQPGTYPASIENQKLKWEESHQTNIGLDIAFFKNRLELTIDAYMKNTSDLLLNAPLPRTTGFDNAVQNIGALQNKGLEFSLTSVNVDKAFKWTTNFNISFNRNKVTDLVGQEIYLGDIAGRGLASLVKEGLPLGTLYGYIYGGVDPATGNAYYIDSLGESTFTPSPEDRVVIGNANPDFIYGMTNTLSYKGWGLMIFLQGSQGNQMLNASRIDMEGMTDPKNQSAAVLARWTKVGDVTDIPKASWGSADNSRISTRFIEDASYLRVKAVSLSYNLPSTWLTNLHLQSVKLYATGENLLTLTKYTGFDPEVGAFGNSDDRQVKNVAQGIDYGTYPQTRNIIFGANITF